METIEMIIFEKKIERKFSVSEYSSSQSHIVIKDITMGQENIFLKLNHEEEYSYLDFTGSPDYKLIYIYKQTEILGGTYAVNNSKGNIIKTSFHEILLITLQTFIDENEKHERSLVKGRALLKELKEKGPRTNFEDKISVWFIPSKKKQ